MAGVMERTLGILELLAAHAEGLPLASIADEVNMPRSAAHRLLTDLARCGYVRQLGERGDYVLTTKLVSLGLSFLNASGIVDVAQPLLDRLAELSGELVRLSVIDGERLTFVAKAQGARTGLRYDPDMGTEAKLSCTASGYAWLSTLTDEEALELVARQGFGKPEAYGPNAPTSASALLDQVRKTRERGFSLTVETFALGMSAIAAPVRSTGRSTVGVISIAGPSFRFTEERMLGLGPTLLAAAKELAATSSASPLMRPRRPAVGEPHPIAAS